ncbi:hypothetical protein FLK61_22845 [Paenalkalicoccus suaedae]|uniref:Spore cortex biosynthesis protein YabQ n=2 Tax=Paenalkalicoccus suaedae TaxID=2592382 RepID=A0A859FA38_9BACI|nr:spore cortex biosynthesis protein YabQ [Paenalkalicoccus suaedae]QKS69648.1 hypothetical protein FLK61_22845 [Paenalkalicoccus suaedae]
MGVLIGTSINLYSRFFRYAPRMLLYVAAPLLGIALAAWYFYLLYQVNYGEVRIYLLLAIVVGYLLYLRLFAKTVTKILDLVEKLVIRTCMLVYSLFYYIIVIPTKAILKVMVSSVMIIGTYTWRIFTAILTLIFKLTGLLYVATKTQHAYRHIKHKWLRRRD